MVEENSVAQMHAVLCATVAVVCAEKEKTKHQQLRVSGAHQKGTLIRSTQLTQQTAYRQIHGNNVQTLGS
jgi:hypothetical protein